MGKARHRPLVELVATALFNKGVTLGRLDRPEEELSAYDEVMSRFGESEAPPLLEEVAKALSNKGMALVELDRPEEALSAYDEVLSRFGESETPVLLELVAKALFCKGMTLVILDRREQALTACNEVVSQFGESEAPALLELVATALIIKGRILPSDDPSGSAQDIEAMLAILPKLDSLPSAVLHALTALSVDLGPVRMRELIQASPAADLLLPLTTALEWELGLEPRVAREVEEVAEDIRRDLAKLKEDRIDGAT